MGGKEMEKQKGITLIALVITIIILLILAGISIATLTGENGILSKANTAQTETEKAGAKEKVQMAVMSSYDNSGKLDYTQLKTNLDNVEGIDKNTVPQIITEQSFDLIVKVDGYEVKIEKNGKVTVEEAIEGNPTPNPPAGDTVKPGEIVTDGNKEYTNNGTAVIPEGFAIVPGCDDVSEGLVISDDAGDTEVDSNNIVANGNQFVWVPVTNIDNFETIEGYENRNVQNYLASCSEPSTSGYNTEVAEYNSMKQSVEENQGFYIGRYEAGKDSKGNLVVKKNSPVYNDIGWGTSMTDITGGAVELSKNFANGKNYQGKVTSTLIYGVQWDATMQFFDSNYLNHSCDENSYVRNSEGKGNYGSIDLIKTGSNESYKMKNIYDMAGNVWEWTMEDYNMFGRVLRGGCYAHTASNDQVSIRGSSGLPGNHVAFGFRIALYL
jgi:hypothetical protein